MAKLSRALLSIPHSSAEVERKFSQLKLVKTPYRSSIKTETLEAILMAKRGNKELVNESDMIDKVLTTLRRKRTPASKKVQNKEKKIEQSDIKEEEVKGSAEEEEKVSVEEEELKRLNDEASKSLHKEE